MMLLVMIGCQGEVRIGLGTSQSQAVVASAGGINEFKCKKEFVGVKFRGQTFSASPRPTVGLHLQPYTALVFKHVWLEASANFEAIKETRITRLISSSDGILTYINCVAVGKMYYPKKMHSVHFEDLDSYYLCSLKFERLENKSSPPRCQRDLKTSNFEQLGKSFGSKSWVVSRNRTSLPLSISEVCSLGKDVLLPWDAFGILGTWVGPHVVKGCYRFAMVAGVTAPHVYNWDRLPHRLNSNELNIPNCSTAKTFGSIPVP